MSSLPITTSLFSPNYIATSIIMKRTQFEGVFLLVEGNSDFKLYNNFIDTSFCKIEICYGKDRVLKIVNILNSQNFKGFLATIDSDYSTLINDSPQNCSNIITSEFHDIEMMMLNSPAFIKLLREFFSENKLKKIAHNEEHFFDFLIENAKPIGCLRLISIRENLNLKFENLKFSSFMNLNSKIDIPKLIVQVKNKSCQPELNNNILKKQIDLILKENYNSSILCCGHDVLEMLSYMLIKVIGSHRNIIVKREHLELNLRLAYELQHFKKTMLYKQIKNWENNNKPYKILKA